MPVPPASSMHALANLSLRLAVLPAAETSRDNNAEPYFSRGFIEDLITDLSRFPNLGLISPHSSFAARLDGLDDRAIAEELGTDLLLKTSVRRQTDALRVNAQLVEPKSGSVLWAERYDTPAEGVFALHDSLVEKVTSALSKQIDLATLEAARRKPVTELVAYDCWLRGIEKLREGNLEADDAARELFERALEIDPHNARAYAGLSLSHFNEWSCQHWELSEVSECRAFQYATKAFQLDPHDSVAHLVLGRVYLFRHEFERAKQHMDRAVELNPNDADHLVQIASCYAFLGEADAGGALFGRALALNPYCEPWYFAYGGFIEIVRRNFDAGIAMALKAPLTSVWIDLAAFISLAHAHRGDAGAAARYRETFLKAFQEKILKGQKPAPGEAFEWLVQVNPFMRPEDTAFYIGGLRKAGFDEGLDATPAAPDPARTSVPRSEKPVFRVESDLRVIVYEGVSVRLQEVKGFKDLECLLAAGGDEIHAADLMGVVSEDGAGTEVMDARARSECAAQIRELQADLAEAEAANDLARVERILGELEPLMDYLAKAVGIGGRSRKLAAPAERARSAVTWRIRSAIHKIAAAHPALGRHLSNSIRTGTFCSYAPEKPVEWLV